MLETPPAWMNKKNSAKTTEQNFLHSNANDWMLFCSQGWHNQLLGLGGNYFHIGLW